MIATLEAETFTVWVPRADTRTYAYGSWGERCLRDVSRWFRFRLTDGMIVDMSDTTPDEALRPLALMAADAMEFGARRFLLEGALKAYGLALDGPGVHLHAEMARCLVEAGYTRTNLTVGELLP